MKRYSVLYAEEVPHYGILDIEADDDASAIEQAKAHNVSSIAIDPDYDNSVCRRIVHIEDETGNIITHDIALDGCFLRYGGEPERLLCDDAAAILDALTEALKQLELFVHFSKAGKDLELEAITDTIRTLVTKHRRSA